MGGPGGARRIAQGVAGLLAHRDAPRHAVRDSQRSLRCRLSSRASSRLRPSVSRRLADPARLAFARSRRFADCWRSTPSRRSRGRARAARSRCVLPLMTVFGARLSPVRSASIRSRDCSSRGSAGSASFGTASVVRFYGDRYAAAADLRRLHRYRSAAALAAIAMIALRAPAAQYAVQHGRATGTFVLPGELAGFLIVLLPIAYALAARCQTRWLRALSWSALGAGAVDARC